MFFMTNQNWQFSIPSEALLTFDLTWPAPIKMLMVLLDTWSEIDGVRGVIPIGLCTTLVLHWYYVAFMTAV